MSKGSKSVTLPRHAGDGLHCHPLRNEAPWQALTFEAPLRTRETGSPETNQHRR